MLQRHFLSPIPQPEVAVSTPLYGKWTVGDLPKSYRDFLKRYGSGYFQRSKITTTEPTRHGLDFVLLNGLAGYQTLSTNETLFSICEAFQTAHLPDYFIPFFADEAVYFCFDYSKNASEPSIRLIDCEMDQWLTIASNFEELLTHLELHVENVEFEQVKWFSQHTLNQQLGHFFSENFSVLLDRQEELDLSNTLQWIAEALQHDSVAAIAPDRFVFLNEYRQHEIHSLPAYKVCVTLSQQLVTRNDMKK